MPFATSGRLVCAVLGNGLVSLASLGLSVSIARVTSTSGFGAFSGAMVAYIFAVGLIRAAFTDNALSRPLEPDLFARSSQRASFIGVVASIVVLILGLVGSIGYLIVLGVSLHGLLMQDFVRTVDAAAGDFARSLRATMSWVAPPLLLCVVSLFSSVDPLLIFSVWAVWGAACGYLLVWVAGTQWRPRWVPHRADTSVSSAFAVDYLVGSGGAALTTGVLGFFDDARLLGAIRGSGTLLGPMNLISTTARSLLLPYLSRRRENPRTQLRAAVSATATQVAVLVPFLAAVQFIPDSWGGQLLGETWELARLVLLPMSVDALFVLGGVAAVAGHRVAFAGRRTVLLRLVTGVARPVVVVFGAVVWGVAGAAWAMAAFAVVSAIAWWVSYVDLSRRPVAG